MYPQIVAFYQNGVLNGRDTVLNANIDTYFDNLTLIPVSDTSLTVINPYIPDPDSILLTHDTLVCGNGPLTLTTSASFWSYTWSTGDTTRSTHVTTPGTYTVTVSNGCATYADSIRVLADTTLRRTYTIADTVICTDQSLTYTLPDSFLADHILWSSGDTGLSSSFAHGIHSFSLSNQCFTFSDTFSIRYTGADTVHLFADASRIFCPGQSYELAPVQPYPDYLWSTTARTDSITIAQSGYYGLTVTDTSGCQITGSVHYVQPVLPTILLTQDTLRQCAAQYPVTITAQSGFAQYYWDGVLGTDQFTISSPDVTVYVRGTTQCGSVSDTLTALSIHDTTGITYSIDSDCTQNVATIVLSTAGSPTILWSDGSDADQVITPLPRQLTISAQYTCATIYDTISLPACAFFTHHLYIPDAFTPNGDGTNDVFTAFGDRVNWKYIDINIYDRWGERVYSSNDLDFRWDGSYRGATTTGVYVYTLILAYTDGKSQSAKGSVTIIR